MGGFGVVRLRVAQRGRAGAASTQARALNCMSPLLLALRPSLDLCEFRVPSPSHRTFALCFENQYRQIVGIISLSFGFKQRAVGAQAV